MSGEMSTDMQNLDVPASHTQDHVDLRTFLARNYRESLVQPPPQQPNGSHAPKSNISKMHRARQALKRSIKKVFGVKAKPAMVMPYEYQAKLPLSRSSSVHSHRSAGPIKNRLSAPEILLTGPSVRGRNKTLSLHSQAGGHGNSASQGEKTPKSFRFSHPTVNSVRPVTPMSISSADLLNETETGGRSRSGSKTSVQTASSVGSIPGPDSQLPPLRPKDIWRNSDQFNTPDGERASFGDFKARLDGHKLSSSSLASMNKHERAPSLQFIARTSTIKLDEPARKPKAAADEAAEIRKARSDALNLLDTPAPQSAQHQQDKSGKMVVAVMPLADMPASAIRVPSGQFPATLLPKQYPVGLTPGSNSQSARPPMQRPHTVAAPSIYKPYTPYVAYNPRVSDASVADALPVQAPFVPSEKKLGKMAGRPKTPDIFATEVPHRQHYSRVESGVFEPVPAIPSQPAEKGEIGRTFLDSPTPPQQPSPPAASSRLAPPAQTTKQAIPRKPVSTPNLRASKPLPPAPPMPAVRPPLVHGATLAPEPHRMNSNRYPFFKNPGANVSTDSVYKRRSIDPVEAKFKKEEAVKTAKQAKIDAKNAKKQEKIIKKQEKAAGKLKKRQDQVAEMDKAVGKLGL